MGAMADNQPRDDHAKQLKQAISRTKQLRGWVSSDPGRSDDFVDALNEATGLRLLSRLWAEAAPEATEAVGAADKLVASRGPVGPYTPLVDAGRYFTALTHVATVQSGMNLPEHAGMTIGAAFAWKDQLTRDGLADELLPRTAVWALLARARGALAVGDLAQANAQADAALNRAREAEFSGAETLILLEALRTDADARFAVDLTDQSIDLLHEAVARWQEWTRADLEQLPRMAKAHLERLVGPVVPLRRDLADRLAWAGRWDEALTVREELSTLLHRTAARRGEQGRVDLAVARGDQTWTLADAGRAQEALRAGADAQQALQALFKAEKPVGSHLPTQALVAPALARAELAAGHPDRALAALDQFANRLQAHQSVPVGAAARAVALLVRAQVQDALADGGAAATSRAQADQLVGDVRAREVERAHHSAQDGLVLARGRSRGMVLPSQLPTPHWEVPDSAASLAPSGARLAGLEQVSDEEAMRRIDEVRDQEARERAVAELRQATERAERERQDAERRSEREAAAQATREQTEREAAAQEQSQQEEDARMEAEALLIQREHEHAEQDRLAAERAEAERQEAERAEAERAEAERREAERREAERGEAERPTTPAVSPLDALRERAAEALRRGDKALIESSHEDLIAALEAPAQADPQRHGRELVSALEHLSEAQGWWGGRAAGKRAKQLQKQWQL